MTDTMPDVLHLPPSPQTRRPPHLFGCEVKVAADVSASGHEQKEKTCKNCGAVRVTILGPILSGKIWRAWRRTADGPQIVTDVVPPCDPDAVWLP